MARITVVATEHPVPLPDGRFVRTAAEEPDGVDLELDLFVRRRIDAGELAEIKTADPVEEPVQARPPAPAPVASAALVPTPAKPPKPLKES